MGSGDGRMIFIKGKEKLLGLLRTCHTAGRFNSGPVHQTPKGEIHPPGDEKARRERSA